MLAAGAFPLRDCAGFCSRKLGRSVNKAEAVMVASGKKEIVNIRSVQLCLVNFSP
jgi:hypothetical protein